jgi:hypothetical protein
MSIRAHTLALAFASLMAGAPLVACAADNMQTQNMQSQNRQTMQQPLPGQPGADTSVGQELRGAPYMVMMVTSSGAMSERPVSAATATELMKHAKPLTGMAMLMHDGKVYAIENMKMSNGRMLYDVLDLPGNLLP